MDNIKIKKIYEEGDLLEYTIEANNDFVKIHQDFYIDKAILLKHIQDISNNLNHKSDLDYFEFGCLVGNYTPSFSIKIGDVDLTGTILIEFDFEVNDNEERKHRCQMYVKTYKSDFESLLNKLLQSINSDCNIEFCLCN